MPYMVFFRNPLSQWILEESLQYFMYGYQRTS